MIHGLHHPAISTPDLKRAIDFYCGLLGGVLVKQSEWAAGNDALNARLGLSESAAKVAMLKIGAAYMELFEFLTPKNEAKTQRRSANQHGIAHLCFVVDDCQAEYRRLCDADVEFHAPPLKMPTGATFTYGRDPDGNIFELVEIPAEANFPNNYASVQSPV